MMGKENYLFGDSFDILRDYMKEERADLVLTSYPDADEINIKKEDIAVKYVKFLDEAFQLIDSIVKPDGIVVLVLTDRRVNAGVFLKHYKAVEPFLEAGYTLKDYKILVKEDVNKVRMFSFNYSHVLILVKEGAIPAPMRKKIKKDVHVFPTFGNGQFSTSFAEFMVNALSKPGDLVVDPFAGRGTVVWVATKLKRRGVGCEINEDNYNLRWKFPDDEEISVSGDRVMRQAKLC
jgi:DNA modification methylase